MQYTSTLGVPNSISLGSISYATNVTRRPAIWIVTKYFYFWAINIVIPSGDSKLGFWLLLKFRDSALDHSATTTGPFIEVILTPYSGGVDCSSS